MPDEQGRDAQNNTPETPNGGTPGSGEQGKIEDLPTWAQTLVKELRSEAADRRKALQKQEEEAAKREQERLAEQGKWKELAEARAADAAKLQPYQQRAAELEKLISEGNQKRIGQIPAEMRTLIPQLPAEQLAGWLDANWGLLTRKAAPDLDAGAGAGSRGASPLTDEEKQAAARMGVSEEAFQKAKAQKYTG